MKQKDPLENQDRKRYWKISQVRCSARVFAEGAESGFKDRFGLVAAAAVRTFSAVGSIFHMTGDLLDGLETGLDEARHAHASSRIRRRRACRRRKRAHKAARRSICRLRQFVNSLTGGRANVHLGISGPTPRDPEKLAAWGDIFLAGLPELDLSPAVRALALALAEELEPLIRELNEALEQAESAWLDEKLDHAMLQNVRKTVDAELDRVVKFLRGTLEFAGQDYLASRVLGKRRGRPRKSATARTAKSGRKSESAATPASEGVRETDSAPSTASEGGRKFDSAPTTASEGGRKFDSATGEAVPGARTEPREIESAPSEPSTAIQEIEDGPRKACTASQKIAEAPCKPCTEPARKGEVDYFQEDTRQEDTPRSIRRRRRRFAEAVLGASKKLLPAAWSRETHRR